MVRARGNIAPKGVRQIINDSGLNYFYSYIILWLVEQNVSNPTIRRAVKNASLGQKAEELGCGRTFS
jgi:hypothetical protein